MNIVLMPEKVDFRISTTDLKAIYTESGGVTLRVDVQTRWDVPLDQYREIELTFGTVAELRCITLNFFELYTDQIEGISQQDDVLAFWESNSYHPDPGFYEVMNSPILNEKRTLFDPRNRLNLKHYLVAGYDSYVEVIASSYQFAVKD
ncbi:hypothetical protein ABIE27_001157 [Paenibacillus sp. 4624]|jgi:hypothetical protein|uniref:Uncharacterized protein n=1 Tax=Paenibacillus amylolyticus TaxID=1451 RepID=A0A5M9WRA9_PAEAM|nr:hypothetical protein [Paenibacillus amylolyticus]KAA8784174.1 hypothetical protein EC604_09965 [Paenibacillus amylolyticus]